MGTPPAYIWLLIGCLSLVRAQQGRPKAALLKAQAVEYLVLLLAALRRLRGLPGIFATPPACLR